jgi:hypothetical protein
MTPFGYRPPSFAALVLAAAIGALAVTSAPLPAAADPPPWAPAHGWRKKHDHHGERVVVVERERSRRNCGGLDNQMVGSTAGAAAGALLGNVAVGPDSADRLAGSVVGAAGGALVGGLVGRSADRAGGC